MSVICGTKWFYFQVSLQMFTALLVSNNINAVYAHSENVCGQFWGFLARSDAENAKHSLNVWVLVDISQTVVNKITNKKNLTLP